MRYFAECQTCCWAASAGNAYARDDRADAHEAETGHRVKCTDGEEDE